MEFAPSFVNIQRARPTVAILVPPASGNLGKESDDGGPVGEAQTGHEGHQQHEKLVRALADQHALTVAQDHDEGVPDEAFDVLGGCFVPIAQLEVASFRGRTTV